MVFRSIALISISAIVIGSFFVSATVFAADTGQYVQSLSEGKLNLIERNLIRALESNSLGLQSSAAQVIRDLNRVRPNHSFSRCVIPLMRIVKDRKSHTGARIVAALALHEIKSARGDFAISRVAKFEKDPRLQRLCIWLTYERSKE